MNRKGPNHNITQSTTSTKTQTKKKINYTQPTVMDFLYSCIIYFFKRIVLCPVHVKIGIYLIALVICSIIKDFQIIPQTSYFSNKHNIFNQYFVKLGWAWTLAVITPFILMTSSIYNSLNLNYIKNHLIRILIATIGWFILTFIFDYIDTQTGSCSLKSIKNKILCKTNKHEWNGFDISGHTFILMHSLFFMNEESKVFSTWELFYKKLNEKIGHCDQNNEILTFNVYERSKKLYDILTPLIKLNFILIGVLSLLWEVMLLTTCLYFHTMLHKIFAAFGAIGIWFLTYKTWYENKNLPLSPGLPGYGSV